MRNKKVRVAVQKRKLSKCSTVCRTYSDLQFRYADMLEEREDVKEFDVNVPLESLSIEGEYTTDFLITRHDGTQFVRECILRNHLTKPLTAKMLDASRAFWLNRNIKDWGIVTNGII